MKKAAGDGFVFTTLIQFSSTTIAVVVDFVNATLMSLTQTIGVILGTNIGTTVAGWVIAFNVNRGDSQS